MLLSPSRAVRYMRCAGSVREEAKYPVRPSGPSAIDGTHTHTLLEHCVNHELMNPAEMIGKSMQDHDGPFVVDAERAARVKVAIDYVRERSLGGTFPVLSEKRVDPWKYTGFHEQAGTVDIRIYRGGMIEVIDYKDGIEPVEVVDNEQLDLYALGALAELADTRQFKLIRTVIIQPKLVLKGLPAIAICERTVEQVLALGAHYRSGAVATFPADAPLTPGKKQCRWCAASGCAARADFTLKAAGVNFPTIDPSALPATTAAPVAAPPTEIVASAATQLAEQDTTSMSDEKLREIIEAAPMLRQTIEQAEAEALRRLESGRAVPGLKLVNGRGSQVWNLSDDEIAEKLKGMGVPKDAIYVTKLVSPSAAKKLTWTKRDGSQKALSDRQLKTMETEYISKLGGKLTVALESDSRAAVVRDATPLFSAVQEPAAIAAPAPAEAPAPAMPDWMQTPAWMQPK